MSFHNIARAGFGNINEIPHLHRLRFHRKRNGLTITIELLTSSFPGAPFADVKRAFVRFMNEFDYWKCLQLNEM